MTRRVSRAALAIGLLAVLLTACGVELDEEPRPIAAENVPFELLAPSSTTSSTSTTVAPAPPTTTRIFLIHSDGFLFPVERTVPAPVRVEDAIEALLEGPTGTDSRVQLRSAVPPETELLGVSVQGATVTIDLSEDFVGPVGDELKIAIAQLVYTATAIPGVTGVLFAIEGENRDVPDGEGRLTSAPLDRSSFERLDPSQATTTTSAPRPPEPGV